MTSRTKLLSKWTIIFGIGVIATSVIFGPSFAQDFRVAYQSRDAGESADDDPEDTGDRGAADAVDDAAQRAAETLTPAERAAALERRAGERVGGRPSGRANVLGMSLQEGGRGRVQVVDVAAASPAFDAGVRKGDVIVSFAGFHGENYRDWIEGMGKLVTDTPDGETIDVELLRGDKRVAARIRAPEANADDPRLPGLLGPLPQQEIQTLQGQAGPAGIPQPNQPIVTGGGSDIFINNAPFSEAFNAGDANVNDRAMAEIFRLNPDQQAARGGNLNAGTDAPRPAAIDATANELQSPAANATASETGRIGIAGFRNDAEGLLVMIDIAGLEPGSYRVGIDDPGIVVGGGPATANENAPGVVDVPTQPVPRSNRGGPTVQTSGNPAANAPQNGALDPDANQQTPGNAAGTPTDGRTDQSNIPPSGQIRPLSTPPSGQARPLTSTPTGLPDTRQPGRADTPSETPHAGTLSQIGVLTVDQSGTGRLQQVVEGVQVADIVGQAIVIHAPVQPPQTAIPPNTNVSGVRKAAGDPNVPAQLPAAAAPRDVPRGAQPPVLGNGQVNGSTQPVAAGIIRLLSDRRPAISATDSPEGQLNSQSQRPATENEPLERAGLPQPPTR